MRQATVTPFMALYLARLLRLTSKTASEGSVVPYFTSAPTITPAALGWGDTADVDWTGAGDDHTVSVTWYHDGEVVEADALVLGNGAREASWASPGSPSFEADPSITPAIGGVGDDLTVEWEVGVYPPSQAQLLLYVDGGLVQVLNVTGAESHTIEIQEAYVGDLYAVVRLTEPGGSYVEATSNTIQVGYPPTLTAVTLSPTTATVGDTVTCSASYSGTDATIAYQWQLDGVDISGATSSTYVTTGAGTLTCDVTVSSVYGPDATGTSDSCTVSAGTTTVLAVQPTAGGRQLYDPDTGAEYTIAASGDYAGCYVDSAGNPLTVAPGYSAGDEVGPQRLAGLLGASVIGDLAAGLTGGPVRRDGARPTGPSDYATTPLLAASWGFMALTPLSTASSSAVLFGLDSGAGQRALIQRVGLGSTWRLLIQTPSGTVTPTLVSQTAESLRYFGGSYNAATGTALVAAWDPADVAAGPDESATATSSGGDLTGEDIILGTHPNLTSAGWGRDVLVAFAWVGVAPDLATLEAAAQVHADGGDEAAIEAVLGANAWPIYGIECGAVDSTDTTALAYIGAEGDGTPVQVVELTVSA